MLNHFRNLGFLEASSFLILLLIAMPLKYVWGMPQAVKVVGMIHGVLFTLYLIVGLMVAKKYHWSLAKLAFAYFAAFIPLGPFIFDKKIFSATN